MAKEFDQEYVEKLEETVRKFMMPLDGIPFSVAIKALSGHSVIPFDPEVVSDSDLLGILSEAAQMAGENAFRQGVFAARPNEAGNRIEPFVTEALKDLGIEANTPRAQSGKRKAQGYPDLEITSPGHVPTYLEIKTYNTAKKDQSFRTFYMSPPSDLDPKITMDAHHLLLSFELTIQTRRGRQAFVPLSWQLYTLDRLQLRVKHEFNASNRVLYRQEHLLAQGEIQ